MDSTVLSYSVASYSVHWKDSQKGTEWKEVILLTENSSHRHGCFSHCLESYFNTIYVVSLLYKSLEGN